MTNLERDELVALLRDWFKGRGLAGGEAIGIAQFLTEPKQHRTEIRAYIRDPDGHLIEVGQITARMSSP